MNKHFCLKITLLILFSITGAAFAQSLDATFGNGGKVTTSIGNGVDYGRAALLQPDGKIVVAGYSNFGSFDDEFAIVRYNSDGSLDITFDTDGKVTTAFSNLEEDRIFGIALQPDGKIVAAGYAYMGTTYDFAVARYNSDGSLDTSFDSDGKVTTPIGTAGDRGQGIALQPDGKIVVVGYSYNGANNDFAIVRYNANGSLDTTFDSDGKTTINFGSYSDRANSVAIQADGKIVVAGLTFGVNFTSCAIARFNTNGSLDTTFDTDGKVVTSIVYDDDVINAIALQPDGKIVAVGYTNMPVDGFPNFSVNHFAILRYNTNGSLDTSFDTDGIKTVHLGQSNDWGYCVQIQPNGKILAGGNSYDATTIDDFALLRLNTDGSIDTTFGIDGNVRTPIANGGDLSFAVLLQPDGKIIQAGMSIDVGISGNTDFALVRYNNDDLGIDAIEVSGMKAVVSPNPFSTSVKIELNTAVNNAVLTIYTISGQKVKEIQNLTGDSFVLNRDSLASGFYLFQLTENGTTIANTKVTIKD